MTVNKHYLAKLNRRAGIRQDRSLIRGEELAEEAKAEGVIGVEPLFHNVKQVLMVRYAKERKVPLWIPVK
jgi:hypothetical protein